MRASRSRARAPGPWRRARPPVHSNRQSEAPLSEGRVQRQKKRPARLLAKVEVADEVPELRQSLTHVGPGIRPSVRLRVEPGAAEEVVLDELGVRVEREHLVVDEAGPG